MMQRRWCVDFIRRCVEVMNLTRDQNDLPSGHQTWNFFTSPLHRAMMFPLKTSNQHIIGRSPTSHSWCLNPMKPYETIMSSCPSFFPIHWVRGFPSHVWVASTTTHGFRRAYLDIWEWVNSCYKKWLGWTSTNRSIDINSIHFRVNMTILLGALDPWIFYLFSHTLAKCHNPNWRSHIFQRGRLNHQPVDG